MTHSPKTSANTIFAILRYIQFWKLQILVIILVFKWRLSSKKYWSLWSFQVAKRNGSHFQKTALEDFKSFCIFSIATGVQSAKLPDFYHGITLDILAYAEAPPPHPTPIFLIGLYVVNHNHLHHKILACCSCHLNEWFLHQDGQQWDTESHFNV